VNAHTKDAIRTAKELLKVVRKIENWACQNGLGLALLRTTEPAIEQARWLEDIEDENNN
jgi:hypothetical protein